MQDKSSRRTIESIGRFIERIRLPAEARRAWREDSAGLPDQGPTTEEAIDAAVAWLVRAQQRSVSADGGVARHYSLIDGWSTSYPETTGYIVPTLLDYAERKQDDGVRQSALQMLDWLVRIQLDGGGFQGGRIDATPVVPVTFNTGQILLGLAAGVLESRSRYLDAMRKAADWLAATQDEDGAWRKHPTPFAEPGLKTYETHVAWGLLEAERVDPGRGYGDAGLRNVRWALKAQRANGWLADCCLNEPERPLTHTLGYALRGILEAHSLSGDDVFLDAARLTADGIAGTMGKDGFIPGRLDSEWRPAAGWACLTGTVQVAHCWLVLGDATGEERYRRAGYLANSFVRRTIKVDGDDNIRGGVKGSFPVFGDYGYMEYLNWPPKFFIDAAILELELREKYAENQE